MSKPIDRRTFLKFIGALPLIGLASKLPAVKEQNVKPATSWHTWDYVWSNQDDAPSEIELVDFDNPTALDNEWRHYELHHTGKTSRIYIDGKLVRETVIHE